MRRESVGIGLAVLILLASTDALTGNPSKTGNNFTYVFLGADVRRGHLGLLGY
jgi:hypothetical protein